MPTRAMAATARRRLRAASNGASLQAAAAGLRRLRSSNAGWHSFLSSSSHGQLIICFFSDLLAKSVTFDIKHAVTKNLNWIVIAGDQLLMMADDLEMSSLMRLLTLKIIITADNLEKARYHYITPQP